MPACRNTPAEAISRIIQAQVRCSCTAPSMISDLDVKPLVKGTDEMASAPTVPKIMVQGMVLYSPPRSVHLLLPVMYSTDPALIHKRGLVDDVAKGVGRGAVEAHGRADAHPADHEAHLVDDGVGQDAAHVVFEQGRT